MTENEMVRRLVWSGLVAGVGALATVATTKARDADLDARLRGRPARMSEQTQRCRGRGARGRDPPRRRGRRGPAEPRRSRDGRGARHRGDEGAGEALAPCAAQAREGREAAQAAQAAREQADQAQAEANGRQRAAAEPGQVSSVSGASVASPGVGASTPPYAAAAAQRPGLPPAGAAPAGPRRRR